MLPLKLFDSLIHLLKLLKDSLTLFLFELTARTAVGVERFITMPVAVTSSTLRLLMTIGMDDLISVPVSVSRHPQLGIAVCMVNIPIDVLERIDPAGAELSLAIWRFDRNTSFL